MEEKAKLQQEKDENEARSEMQLSALNENLTTLRGDLTALQVKLQDTEKENDELQGKRLGR